MSGERIYHIHIRAQASAEEINPTSPVQIRVLESTGSGTLFSVSTDQSGLIGLLRHLHGLGFDLISIDSREIRQ